MGNVRQRFMNLTFHGIGEQERGLEPGEDAVWVSTKRFLSVLDAVVGRDDVRITFDDGNASDVRLALPALRRRGLTATFFVVADRLGVKGFLTADDLRALAAVGMTVGCHGMRHRAWRGLGDVDLGVELVEARRIIEGAVGRPVTEAACPFGSYGRRSLRALKSAGYERVYTSDRGPARAGEWLQARTSVTEHDRLEALLASKPSTYAAVRRRAELSVKRWR
jgi:peptidoglycan/xylan/chitin deacetylase (PgdA/CDA1 family)